MLYGIAALLYDLTQFMYLNGNDTHHCMVSHDALFCNDCIYLGLTRTFVDRHSAIVCHV